MEINKPRNVFLRTSIREVDEEALKITHTVNTKALDRYNTVVLPKGADVKHFLNNSVVLWSHNMDSATPKIPIGRCVELDIREEEIVATTEFNKNDPLAVKVFNAYRDGFLHAWSIGFIPLKYDGYNEENREELNKKYGLSISAEQVRDGEEAWSPVFVIYKWELLEYSAVPVPGNPEALDLDTEKAFKRELVSRGLLEEKEVDLMDMKEMITEKKEEVKEEQDIKPEVKEDEPVVEDTEEVVETPEESEDVSEETPDEGESKEESTEEVDEEKEEDAGESEEETEAEPEVEEKQEEVEEEKSKDVEVPVESTEDETEVEPETVAEDEEVEEEEETEEREALDTQILENLAQENKELSERIAKLEAKVDELNKLNTILEEIKQDLDVDNIDKVREATQKRKSDNPDSFFSNFLRSRT